MTPAEQVADLLFDDRTHLYSLAGRWVPGVTGALEGGGLMDYSFLPLGQREEYLERGRKVHEATHADDKGRLDERTVDPGIMGYVEGWRAFRRDFGFGPIRIEQIVCHRQHLYAGRLDRTGTIRAGGEIIVDIKTGTAPKAVAYQLAAYAACLPHPRMRRRRCVEVHANGSYKVLGFETRDYQHDLDMFLCALRIYREMNR